MFNWFKKKELSEKDLQLQAQRQIAIDAIKNIIPHGKIRLIHYSYIYSHCNSCGERHHVVEWIENYIAPSGEAFSVEKFFGCFCLRCHNYLDDNDRPSNLFTELQKKFNNVPVNIIDRQIQQLDKIKDNLLNIKNKQPYR